MKEKGSIKNQQLQEEHYGRMKESENNRSVLIDFPIYLNWHLINCVYICVATFFIGIYTNVKFNLF